MPTLPTYNRRIVADSIGVQPRASMDTGNQLAGIASGLSNVGDALERKRDNDDRLDAGARLAEFRASLESELATLETTAKPGEEFMPAALAKFDQLRQHTLAGVASGNGQRFLMERLNVVRGEVATRAVRFETEAGAKWKLDQGKRAAQNVATVAAQDPARALVAMREQEVAIDGLSNPLLVTHLRENLRKQVSEAATAGLVQRDPAAALGLLNKRQIEGKSGVWFIDAIDGDEFLKSRREALHGAETFNREVRMTHAQKVADAIMRKGLPLDQAMQSAERDFEGEDERVIKSEIAARYSYAEASRRDFEEKTYGTAQLEVEQNGRVKPATWASLTDTHRAAILNRQQSEARRRTSEAAGKPVKTDFGLYLDLRQQAIDEPEKFAKLDLKLYVDRIGGAQLEQLVDLKGKAAQPAKGLRDAVTLTQQMNATMSALKIKRPEAKGKFQSFVQSAVDDATQGKGKPLTFDERQQVIDKAVLQGPDPDAWLWGEKRLFELTPDQRARFKPNAATDAPATEIEALNEALKAQGLPQTPANRLALYGRAMGKAAR